MSSEAKARAFRPDDNALNSDLCESSKILGINKIIEGTFPNIEMNNATHLNLVQFIEKAIVETNAQIVVTHHPADTIMIICIHQWHVRRLSVCFKEEKRYLR